MTDMKIETNIYGAEMLTGFAERRRPGFYDAAHAVNGPVPVDQARRLIGWLPLESVSVGSSYLTEDGVLNISEPDQKHLLHPFTHEVLGRHTQGYKVHGYEDTLLRDAASITSGSLGIAKVTQLGGGRRAAVQYELDENVTTSKGVEFRPFLTAATSLDGSIATSFFTGSQVIVCDNTMTLAIKQAVDLKSIYRVRHTRNSEVNVAAAREALDLVFKQADEFTAEVERLTNEYVSDSTWKAFVDALVPRPKEDAPARTKGNADRKRAELNRLWNTDDRVAPWANSAYGVIAAVNTWANQIQTVKGGERGVRNVDRFIKGDFAKADQLAIRTLAAVR